MGEKTVIYSAVLKGSLSMLYHRLRISNRSRVDEFELGKPIQQESVPACPGTGGGGPGRGGGGTGGGLSW